METNEMVKQESFTYSFYTAKSPEEVFRQLLDIEQWWSGLHGETINGESATIGDVFTFEAGGGMHYSKQKLVELVPNKSVVWEVVDSKLTFLNDTSEWTGTHLRFDIATEDNKTKVTFTHKGLVPQIECYHQCSTVWPKYLQQAQQQLS
jgi:uncharacterized protein YndB with AHSA1/START domain